MNSVFPRSYRPAQIQVVDEYVDLQTIRNFEHKVQNVIDTLDNDELTKQLFSDIEIDTLKITLTTLKATILLNTKEEQMKKNVFDALEKRFNNTLERFYAKHQ